MSGDSEIRRQLAEQYHRDLMDDPEQGTPPVKQVAVDSDINVANLYKFGMADETDEPKFSQFVRMYRASNGGLFRTLRKFVNLCDNTLVIGRIPETVTTDGSVTEELLDMTITGGRVVETIAAAFADGTLTDVEVNRSLDIIEQHEQQIAAIKAELVNGPAVVKTQTGIHVRRMQA